MRILESAPERYDAGMRWLTLGAVERCYRDLLAAIRPGDEVLDVGCGSGALALGAARRGARVRALDLEPEMLAVARQRAAAAGLDDRVEFLERGVAELDAEASASRDVVTCGLCLSELGGDERDWTLRHAARILRPGGRLLVADEVAPSSPPLRLLVAGLRLPLAAVTWVVTGRGSRPVPDLEGLVTGHGFTIQRRRCALLGTFLALESRRPGSPGGIGR